MERGRSWTLQVLCGLGPGVCQGTGKMLKRGQMGKGTSPLFHSLQPGSVASALGTGSLGSIKGPSVSKEGTEMGSRRGAWRLPQTLPDADGGAGRV